MASASVEEYVVDYTDTPVDKHNVGFFDIKVERDMEPPIWVYYELDGFHQNHRKYLKSRSHDQLKESKSPPKVLLKDLEDCKPWVTSSINSHDIVNYPCGLVAFTVFNDSYVMQTLSTQAGQPSPRIAVDSRAKTIAWANNGKFSSMDPEAIMNGDSQNQELVNMWILQRFPPVACEQVVISNSKPYVPVIPAMKNVTVKSRSRQMPITDCQGYFGNPTCKWMRGGSPFDCTGPDYKQVRVPDWGIESGHFQVWMRIAGLPNFRKLWGKIDTKIQAGSSIRVHFVNNFPVKPFRARKAFVLSTATALGGRNDAIGIAYLVVGSCCLIFGISFMCCRARPLGDVSLLGKNPKYTA
jgi:hypothetical protein